MIILRGKMKKILGLIVIGLFVISSFGTVASINNTFEEVELSYISDTITISEHTIKKSVNNYVVFNLDEATSYLMIPGEPILPVINKKYTFPLNTVLKDIHIKFYGKNEYILSEKIAPAPRPASGDYKNHIENSNNWENENVYLKDEFYPKEDYIHSIHVGYDGFERVLILNFRCFPIRYNPFQDKIEVIEKICIEITYEPYFDTVSFLEEYDMVIITPEIFSSTIEPLVEHKNNNGVQTRIKTTEEIYDQYPGRDNPEKIKYFIKDAIETWNISYVLLVGGKKSLLFGNWGYDGPLLSNDALWYVPVRYAYVVDTLGEKGHLSDLYFADVYKYEDGNPVFDDWDSNGNDVFAEWWILGKDTLDLYPDVFVGRLPCRNKFEVQIMVNKIMNYEKNIFDPSWFKKMVVVGGDSFDDRPPLGDDFYEGEERNQLALDYMPGFEPVKLWASHEGSGDPVPSPEDIKTAINDGCGFLYFAGHGSPATFNTHWVHIYDWNNSCGGINIYQMMSLFNGKKLPVTVIGACHNSEFNVSLFDYLKNPYTYVPTPECWSWWLTRKIGGGSIATIGYTGMEYVALYGWDSDDIPDCVQYFSGFIDTRFFHAYGIDDVNILGEAWGQAVTEYLDMFIDSGSLWDYKTAQQWILFGDPSLKIGEL
jgi:hypothetical protein